MEIKTKLNVGQTIWWKNGSGYSQVKVRLIKMTARDDRVEILYRAKFIGRGFSGKWITIDDDDL